MCASWAVRREDTQSDFLLMLERLPAYLGPGVLEIEPLVQEERGRDRCE
jgi:hypothetical protein